MALVCTTNVSMFPRGGRELPRRFAPVGSHLSRYSRWSRRFALQSTNILLNNRGLTYKKIVHSSKMEVTRPPF